MGVITAALLLAAAAPPPPKITLEPPAPNETFGDWQITPLGNGAAIAAVSNNAGATFGVICSSRQCTAFFNPQITCDDGDSYPALVNAPAAAFSVKLTCEKLNDTFLFNLPIEGGITEAMSVGGVLGIAMPMASGQFQVARFSLTGAARATARAAQIANGRTPSERQHSSDKQTL